MQYSLPDWDAAHAHMYDYIETQKKIRITERRIKAILVKMERRLQDRRLPAMLRKQAG